MKNAFPVRAEPLDMLYLFYAHLFRKPLHTFRNAFELHAFFAVYCQYTGVTGVLPLFTGGYFPGRPVFPERRVLRFTSTGSS